MQKPQSTAVRRKYEFLAKLYDIIYWNYTRKTIGTAITQSPLKNIEQVIDIGCGTGALIVELLKQKPLLHILGIDLSEEMLKRAEEKALTAPNLSLKQGDFLELDLPSNHFDMAFDLSNFHYFSKPTAFCQKAFEVLKPGGKILLIDWVREGIRPKFYQWYMKRIDSSFVQIYSRNEMTHLLEHAGFRVQHLHTFNMLPLWHMMCVVAEKP